MFSSIMFIVLKVYCRCVGYFVPTPIYKLASNALSRYHRVLRCVAAVICRLVTACCGASVPPPAIMARFLSWQDAKIRSLDYVLSLFSGSAAEERPSIWPWEEPSSGTKAGGVARDGAPAAAGGHAVPPDDAAVDVPRFRKINNSKSRPLSYQKMDDFRSEVFLHGILPSARRELWPALLGVLPAERRSPDSVAARKAWKREYKDLIRQWEDLYLDEESTGTQESQARAFSKEQWTKVWKQVELDVERTDKRLSFYYGDRADNPNVLALERILLSYSWANPETGYCQGMSEVAAVIFFVIRSEWLAYACFSAVVQRMHYDNFLDGLPGTVEKLRVLGSVMKAVDPELSRFIEDNSEDYYTYAPCFNWLHLAFKRELPTAQVASLWERMWACTTMRHAHAPVLVTAAILRSRRHDILNLRDPSWEFHQLVKEYKPSQRLIDVTRVLHDAEACHADLLEALRPKLRPWAWAPKSPLELLWRACRGACSRARSAKNAVWSIIFTVEGAVDEFSMFLSALMSKVLFY